MSRKKTVQVDYLLCSKCGNSVPLSGHQAGDQCGKRIGSEKSKLCDGILIFHSDEIPRQVTAKMPHLPYREI